MNERRPWDPFAIEPFEQPFRALLRPWKPDLAEAAPRIMVDVNEQEGSFLVKAEIPGARREDIDVRVEGNQVTISVEVKTQSEEKKGTRVLRRECHSRSFALGRALDEEKGEAQSDKGILKLTPPKKSSVSNRMLKVQ